MRFLITCYKLDLSGSSTYTFTLASELKNKGHQIDVFSPFPEIIGDKLKEKGINIYNNLEKIADENYNCIIAQHNTLSLLVRNVKPQIPMIFISHGVLTPQASLEQPPSIDINIQKYIAISEEIKDNLVGKNGISAKNIELIRNFVDTKRFSPRKKIKEKPETVLFISNRFIPKIHNNIKAACRKLKLKLITIGKNKSVFNTEDYINKSDIVISLGRGILESMACAKAAIVYDYQGGDGIITKDNIDQIKKCNFSGRKFKKNFKVDELIEEIKKYNSSMGEINRQIILKDHNSSLCSERIINVCQQVQKNFIPRTINISRQKLICYQIKNKIKSLLSKFNVL